MEKLVQTQTNTSAPLLEIVIFAFFVHPDLSHQHLKKQVGHDAAAAVLEDLLGRCGKYFVFRGPDIDEVVKAGEAKGFSVKRRFPRGKLNPICSLVRD